MDLCWKSNISAFYLSIVLQALCLWDLILWIYFSLSLYNRKGFDLQLSSIWVWIWQQGVHDLSHSQPPVLFLLTVSFSIIGYKEYNQSDFDIYDLVMSMCRVFSCVVGRGCLLWPVRSLSKTLLAFALLHSVFQGQICLLSRAKTWLTWILKKGSIAGKYIISLT